MLSHKPKYRLPNSETIHATTTSPRRVIGLREKLLITLSSVIVALLICEIVVRLLSATALARHTRNDRPDFYYSPRGSEKPQDFNFSLEKPANTYRIVAVGDSFTFPTGMQFDDAYPKRLERMLNLAHGEMCAQVINLGQMGASAGREERLLKRGMRFHPDLAMLQITLNDPDTANLHQLLHQYPDRYGFGTLQISRETHPLLYYWKTAALVATRIHNTLSLPALARYYKDVYDDPRRWSKFVWALEKMKRRCQKNNVRFVAVVFPFFHVEIDNNYPFAELHAHIHRALDELQIPFLDLTKAYENIEPDRLHLIVGEDSHPNEIAHRIAADHIYSWLERSHLLPEPLVIKDKFIRRGVRPKRLAPDA